MTVKELRSRIINRSRDGLANYSFIAKNSVSIVDLNDIQKYFMFENILESLLNKGKLELKINHNIDNEYELNLADDNELKQEYEKSNISLIDNINFVDWLISKQAFFKGKIEKLNKKHKELERETGINCLRIGLFYVEGKFTFELGDEIFRAPIFFIKIKIEVVQNKTLLVIDKNDNFIELNDVFFERIAFIKKQKLNYELNEKISSLFEKNGQNETSLKTLEKVIVLIKKDIFEKFDIEIENYELFCSKTIKKFSKSALRKKDIIKNIKNYNSFMFFNYATIGIFKSTSFEIISDLEKWENQDGDEYLNELDNLDNGFNSYFDNISEDFDERKINQITDLDFSQKSAILKSLESSTVIKGPPGTGKSQTIANLIINIIADNKNLLFSAEKKVATEIVYNNLNVFKNFSIKIHDLSKDKKNFYQQLSENWKFIQNNRNDGFDGYITKNNNQIDDAFNQIKKLKTFLTSSEYNFYLKCLKEDASPNSIIDNVLQKLINLNFFSKFNIQEENGFNSAIKELRTKKKVIDFYNQVIKFSFFFDNFDYLANIINFDWYDSDIKGKKILIYFVKSKILKKKPNFLNLFFARKVPKESNYDFDEIFNYLRTLTKEEVKNWIKLKENFSQIASLEIIFKDIKTDKDILSLVQRFYILEFKKTYKEIINIEKTDWNKIIKNNLAAKVKYTKLELRNKIKNQIFQKLVEYYSNSSENNKKFRNFIRIITENKRLRSIKWFIENFKEIIFIMTPILITSVDIIPSIIPLERSFFDYTIFDEASQIYLEKTIAVLYRGQKNIIVGDDKQLAPTNYFLKNIELEDNEENEVDLIAERAEDFSSLLDYAYYKFQRVNLKYHYRSIYRELIEFSNHHFYESNLIFVDYNETIKTMKPIKEVFVGGIWDGQVNEIEANAVLNLIEKIVSTKKENESIGIITFNKKQSELIKEKLDKNINPLIEKELSSRTEKDFLFVKNLEEVQGDERDIIILAISFAHRPDGRFYRNFGPINKIGGENRINVAITRAKKQIYVVKSIRSKDILIGKEIKEGAIKLGKYLEYVEKLQYNDLESNEIKSLFLSNNSIENDLIDKSESILETEIYNKLVKAFEGTDYLVKQQIDQSGYRIDLAIWDKINYKYILAIECDGNTFHSRLPDKERDWYRQNFLENKGWIFYRINSHNWWKFNNQDNIINDIKEKIQIINDNLF